MPRTRRLTDLYQIGTDVTVGDDDGEPVTVWIRKLNDVDHDTAVRRANAARARVLALRSAPDDDGELASVRMEAGELGREGWVAYLVEDAVARRRPVVEARVGAEPAWSAEDYLQGLRDAWVEGLEERWLEDPDDAEAARVLAELARFSEAVEARLAVEADDARRDLEGLDDAELTDRVVERIVAVRADVAWLSEFRRCEIWLGTREADHHRKRHFSGREEVDELAQEVLVRLAVAFQELNVDPTEGKGWRGLPASSTSSAPSAAAATAEPSGPEGAAA